MARVTRPRVESVSARDLVTWARDGRIRLPSFQRAYRWERSDVTALFDSVLRGYPIGNLLVWQRAAPKGRVAVGNVIVDAPEFNDAYWIVDGQQRITSLVGALTADENTIDPRFRVYFDASSGQFRSLTPNRTPERDWLPIALTLDTARVNAWIRDRPHLAGDQIARVDELVAAVRDYVIPMYIVSSHDEQALRDIFDRMNTFGKALKSAEIFNALHAATGNEEPSDLASLGTTITSAGFGEISSQMLTQSLLAIRNPKVDRDFRKEFEGSDDLADAFLVTERAILSVVGFLREYAGIPHIKLLPYALYVPVLARYIAKFGSPSGRAADLLCRWIWRGAVLGVAPQGNTVGLRKNASAVYDDPIASAERLLELLPRTGGVVWRPDLSQTRLNSAHGKVNILGLLSARPSSFPAAQKPQGPVDVADTLNQPNPPTLLVPVDEEIEGMGGRLLAPGMKSDAIRWLLSSHDFDEDFLAGHCLDGDLIALLRARRIEELVARRSTILASVISDHVQKFALFGFYDGPNLAGLFDDVEQLSK